MSNLKAIKRENLTTGSTKRLRADGFIPAILYGGNNPNQNISISKKEISNIISSDTFLSKVLEIEVDGKKEKVIPRDVSYHVISEEPIHIDFMRIVSGKKIILEIPVKFINHPDSPGLKRGGVLNIVRRKVELKCPAVDNKGDENIVNMVYHYYPEIQSRFTLLNNQYNVGCTQFDMRYDSATKPIYVGAFKPDEPKNINKFIGKDLLSQEILDIFKENEISC